MIDVQDPLLGQFFKVETVAFIKISADGLWVVVHHDGLPAQVTERSDAGDRTPVKLDTAT